MHVTYFSKFDLGHTTSIVLSVLKKYVHAKWPNSKESFANNKKFPLYQFQQDLVCAKQFSYWTQWKEFLTEIMLLQRFFIHFLITLESYRFLYISADLNIRHVENIYLIKSRKSTFVKSSSLKVYFFRLLDTKADLLFFAC